MTKTPPSECFFVFFSRTHTPCFEEKGSCVSKPAAKVMSVNGAPLFLQSSAITLVSTSVHFITHLQNPVVELLCLVSIYIVSGSTDRYDLHMRAWPHLFDGAA